MPKIGNKTVLPERSLLIRQKLIENAKIKKNKQKKSASKIVQNALGKSNYCFASLAKNEIS